MQQCSFTYRSISDYNYLEQVVMLNMSATCHLTFVLIDYLFLHPVQLSLQFIIKVEFPNEFSRGQFKSAEKLASIALLQSIHSSKYVCKIIAY